MSHEIKAASWDEFCAVVRDIRQEYAGHAHNLWFRGQSNSDWNLATTLERRAARSFSFIDYYRLAFRIRPQVETESGTTWNVPTFKELAFWARQYDENHYDMLAHQYLTHLRHNGFPSPFLDWSRSPYVAAYFAFAGAKSDSVAIYAYLEAPDGTKGGGSGFPAIRTLGPYVATHKRHFRQQSTYTVCANFVQSDFDNAYEWRFVSHEDVFNSRTPTRQDLLWKVVVPAGERLKVLSLLDEFNLNAYLLFGSEESLMETLAYREMDVDPTR